ncbi:MAG: class I SAM-dependent methyltransferase [Pseudoxanthomonas sp.]
MNELSCGDWLERNSSLEVRESWARARQSMETPTDWSRASGCCFACRAVVLWKVPEGVDPMQPNIREQILCSRCGCNARVRTALALLREAVNAQTMPNIYVTEQATETYVWVQRNFGGNVQGSEFAADAGARETLTDYLQSIGGHGKVQFEDVTRLTFADSTFDGILSLDVLEHVPDYTQALREFVRVLKPGGTLVATFPFTDGADTILRARVTPGGEIEHILEPEYHGDPISGGVLCFNHFGWDVLQVARAAGFSSVRMTMPRPADSAAWYGLWTLIAVR